MQNKFLLTVLMLVSIKAHAFNAITSLQGNYQYQGGCQLNTNGQDFLSLPAEQFQVDGMDHGQTLGLRLIDAETLQFNYHGVHGDHHQTLHLINRNHGILVNSTYEQLGMGTSYLWFLESQAEGHELHIKFLGRLLNSMGGPSSEAKYDCVLTKI